MYHNRVEHIGARELRDQLGRRLDEAYFRNAFLVIEKNGEPRAAIVPIDWLKQHRDDVDD